MPTLIQTTPYFSLYEVVEGVYAAIVQPGTGAWGNAAIVDLGDQTLVFDTFGTPAPAHLLREAAERLTGRRVSYVVNSHRHADHVLGNSVFRDLPILAHHQNRTLIAEMTPRFLGFLREQGNGYLESLEAEIAAAPNEAIRRDTLIQQGEIRAICEALDDIELTLPTVTFDEQMTIYGSARTAHIVHCGANHTPSDSVLWLPEERVLVAGDIVQVQFHPSMGQGDHRHWVKTMDKVLEWNVDWVIPGHGEVGTGADIQMMKQYVQEITATAEAAATQHLTEAEVIALPTPTAYAAFGYSPGWGQNVLALMQHALKD